MRQHTPELAEVITGPFTRRLVVNVFHGRDLVQEGLAFERWSLDGSKSSRVKSGGSGVIVYPSVKGESLSPVGTRGDLSAFRARIELVMVISAGDFEQRVSLGLYRVVKNPTATDFYATVKGEQVVVGSRVEVSFRSLDENTRRRGFWWPEQPPSFDSCFDELRRITGMPVEENVDDQPIPPATVWEAKRGGRLDAVHVLADVLGGVPVVNSRGAWEIIPNTPGALVGALSLGERGTVTSVGSEIDTDEVFNVIVGTFEDDQRRRIDAIASITDGDLATSGTYEENTQYVTDDRIKTQSAADAFVRERLAQSISGQSYDVSVQCHVNPIVELGDVLALVGWERPLVGELVSFAMSDGPYMNVTLRVARDF